MFVSDPANEDDSEPRWYNVIKKIGKGTFSTVYLVRDPKTQEEYAMKAHFQSSSLEDKKRTIIINDALSIPFVQGHENIITLKEVFLSGRIVSA